jgi:hypothetical protein
MNQSWRRRLTYGSNATLVTIMGVFILALLYVLASETRVRWDLTNEGRNTLTADMLAKLALLDDDGEDVQITAFSAQRGEEDSAFKNRAMKDLLLGVDANSSVVKWRFVDFDKERLTAERLGVTQYSHVVVQRGTDRVDIRARDLFRKSGRGEDRRISFLGEISLARSFSQLHTPRRQVVYVLQGHGEADPEERGPSGLADLADALDVERYDVETLDLISTQRDSEVPSVPDDAAMVLVAGGAGGWTDHETDALVTYLSRGGGLLLALDPGAPVPSLLARMGVGVPSGVVLDTQVVFPFWDRPIPRIQTHEMTQGLRAGKLTPVLSHVAPLMVSEPLPEGIRATSILRTSRSGWIERGGELRNGAPSYEPELDELGPVDMAVAVQIRPGAGWVRVGKPFARVLVVGDSEFLENGLFSSGPGNGTFALDAVHWLSGADARVASVGARRQKVRRLAITQEQLGSLRWISMGILPCLIGLLGFAVRMSRRGR